MRILLILVLTILGSGVAFAHEMGSGGMMGGMMGMPMMGMMGMMGHGMMGYGMGMGVGVIDNYLNYSEELNLSGEQIKSLKDLRSAYRKENAEKQSKLYTLREELHDLWNEDEVDYRTVDKKLRQIEDLERELRTAYFALAEKADKVLSKEQRKRWRTLSGPSHMMKEGVKGMEKMMEGGERMHTH